MNNNMLIIEIKNIREIPHDIYYRTYCAEPSPEAATQADREKYGSDPKIIYHRIWPSGRSTVYIPIDPVMIVFRSLGVIIDRNERSEKSGCNTLTQDI